MFLTFFARFVRISLASDVLGYYRRTITNVSIASDPSSLKSGMSGDRSPSGPDPLLRQALHCQEKLGYAITQMQPPERPGPFDGDIRPDPYVRDSWPGHRFWIHAFRQNVGANCSRGGCSG